MARRSKGCSNSSLYRAMGVCSLISFTVLALLYPASRELQQVKMTLKEVASPIVSGTRPKYSAQSEQILRNRPTDARKVLAPTFVNKTYYSPEMKHKQETPTKVTGGDKPLLEDKTSSPKIKDKQESQTKVAEDKPSAVKETSAPGIKHKQEVPAEVVADKPLAVNKTSSPKIKDKEEVQIKVADDKAFSVNKTSSPEIKDKQEVKIKVADDKPLAVNKTSSSKIKDKQEVKIKVADTKPLAVNKTSSSKIKDKEEIQIKVADDKAFSVNKTSSPKIKDKEEARIKVTDDKPLAVSKTSSPKIKDKEEVQTEVADDKPFSVNATTVLNRMYSRLKGTRTIKEVQEEIQNITSRPLVNPHDFDYIHNAPEACKGRKVTLLIAVPCRQNSFLQRQTIRHTWGQYANDTAYNVVLLFFLGSTPDSMLQKRVDKEAGVYKDIVQETFRDSYRNLTLKSVAIMRWASVYCPDSTFVLKADDDVYVNVPRLLRDVQISYATGKQFFITGFVGSHARVRRDKKSKWYISRQEYAKDRYPRYVSGPAYVMTTVAAMRLYVESLFTKLFSMEDIYLTGFCAQQAKIERLGNRDFPFVWKASLLSRPCELRQHAAEHKVSPQTMEEIYALLRPLELKNDDQFCVGT